jgi:hypothetical protein
VSEHWLPIPGWADYEVSDQGRVRRLERHVTQRGLGGKEYTRTFPERIIRGKLDGRGYLTAHLRHAGRDETLSVHRLVLSVFFGEAPEGADGCHRNGDKLDNRVENLYWGSRSENILDAVRHGTHSQTKKTHCPRGHEYTPENTYTHVRNRPGGKTSRGRECKTCHRVRHGKPDRLRGLVE